MTRIVVRVVRSYRALFHRCPAWFGPGAEPAGAGCPGGRFAARARPASEHSGRSVVTTARRHAAPPVADGTPAVAGHRRQPPRSGLAGLVAVAARVVGGARPDRGLALRARRHPRRGRAAERRRHHRAPAARARARPRTGRRTGSPGAGEGRLVGRARDRRAGSTKRPAPGTPGSTRCGRSTARPTRRSRRPCAASSGRSRPCFPTDESPPTRRPCPAPRPARSAARRFREAIQVHKQ